MKNSLKLIAGLALVSALGLNHGVAADAKDYQVTGPVLEVNPSYIVVKKGEQKWQIAADATTKGAKPKVGDRVTVRYTMTATEIELKPGKEDDAKSEKKAAK